MLLVVRALLHVLVNFMLAAGLAALGASVSVWLSAPASAREWLQPVFFFALRTGIAFLFASICARILMPARASLSPRTLTTDDSRWTVAGMLIVALGIAVAVQLPALLAWWSRSATLPAVLIPDQPDPFGTRFVVAAFANATPLLLAFGSVAFLVVSITVCLPPVTSRLRLVTAGTVVACAYLFGAYSTLSALEDAATYIPTLPGAESEPWLMTILSWAREHAGGGGTLLKRLAWIATGYAGAVLVTIASGRRDSAAVAVIGPPADSVLTTSDDQTGAAGESIVGAPPSSAEGFDVLSESTYAIRARGLGPMAFFTRVPEYDIECVPSSRQHRFSFSWETGMLRREPAGPDVVHVTTRQGQGIRSILSRPSYEVVEASTKTPLARLVPSGPAWSIVDEMDRQVAQVEGPQRVGDATRYIAHSAGAEVCRFDWAMLGATIWTAELSVEFAQKAPTLVDRRVALVVGVLLDEQVRRQRQRRYSS